jgi:hypothetical protein
VCVSIVVMPSWDLSQCLHSTRQIVLRQLQPPLPICDDGNQQVAQQDARQDGVDCKDGLAICAGAVVQVRDVKQGVVKLVSKTCEQVVSSSSITKQVAYDTWL